MQFPQTTSYPATSDPKSLYGSRKPSDREQARIAAASGSLQVESFEAETLTASLTTSDGDSATFSVASLKYEEASISTGSSGKDPKGITNYIGKDFANAVLEWKKQLIEALYGNKGDDKQDTSGTEAVDPSSGLAIPAYWNADNTSTRIVSFATAFYSSFKGEGSEFLSKIKDAIEKGFSEARGMLGTLPGQVESLVSDTYNQVFKKLDDWAQENGIGSDENAGSKTVDQTA